MALARVAVLLCLYLACDGATASTSSLGDYMSSWVKSQQGKRVGSDATHHRQTECWDLAMAAIEHAKAKGFSIPRGPSSYVWSSETVSYKHAQPGDIVQFVSWKEKVTHPDGSWSTHSTGSHHTAVVTSAWNSKTCGLQVEEQNPSPVHQGVYHPCSAEHISGSMVVYRLSTAVQESFQEGGWPVPAEFQEHVEPIASTSSLGDYMSSWVKSQQGKRVGSDATHHRQTECWDLAMAAIEHAKAKGFSIPRGPSSYVWSSETVSYKHAQPGDIVQFVSWKEKVTHPDGSWSTHSTGSHHTAVVTSAWNSKTCGLQVEEQNPSPVHQGEYHPCSAEHISGSMVVYRLSTSVQRSVEEATWPVPAEFQAHTESILV